MGPAYAPAIHSPAPRPALLRPRRGRMAHMEWKRLFEIGMRQGGLVTPSCAVHAGLSRAMLTTRARQEG